MNINSVDQANQKVTEEEQAVAHHWLTAILKQSNDAGIFKLYKNQGNLKTTDPIERKRRPNQWGWYSRV